MCVLGFFCFSVYGFYCFLRVYGFSKFSGYFTFSTSDVRVLAQVTSVKSYKDMLWRLVRVANGDVTGNPMKAYPEESKTFMRMARENLHEVRHTGRALSVVEVLKMQAALLEHGSVEAVQMGLAISIGARSASRWATLDGITFSDFTVILEDCEGEMFVGGEVRLVTVKTPTSSPAGGERNRVTSEGRSTQQMRALQYLNPFMWLLLLLGMYAKLWEWVGSLEGLLAEFSDMLVFTTIVDGMPVFGNLGIHKGAARVARAIRFVGGNSIGVTFKSIRQAVAQWVLSQSYGRAGGKKVPTSGALTACRVGGWAERQGGTMQESYERGMASVFLDIDAVNFGAEGGGRAVPSYEEDFQVAGVPIPDFAAAWKRYARRAHTSPPQPLHTPNSTVVIYQFIQINFT